MNRIVNGMVLLFALALTACAQVQMPATSASIEVPPAIKNHVVAAYGKLPLSFEENRGRRIRTLSSSYATPITRSFSLTTRQSWS